MNLRQRIGRELWWLGHACGRIANEFKDMTRERTETEQLFWCIAWVSPIAVSQRDAFTKAVERAIGAPLNQGHHSWLNAGAVPRETGVFGCLARMSSADPAAMLMLTALRTALHELRMDVRCLRVEVIPAEGARSPSGFSDDPFELR